MTKPNLPDTVGSALKDLLRRVRTLETAPQLTKASIKDGALRILDAIFDVRLKLGRLDADLDGDGEDDYGLVIFDAAGDWALLGTKQGVFVRGQIQGGTIDIGGADASSFHVDAAGRLWLGAALFADGPFRVDSNGNLTVAGGTIVGASIETATAPAPRVRVTDDAPAPYEAGIQFFQGIEPVGAQGFIAQYLDTLTDREILGLAPSGLAGSGFANRALIFVVSKKADGTGDREILLMAGEKLYADAALTELTGRLKVGNRGVHTLRAGLAVDGGAVDPSVTQVFEQAGYWDVTTNAAGDGTLTWPEVFPNGVLDVQVTLSDGNLYTGGTLLQVHNNPNTTNVGVRFFDAATGNALGAGVAFRLNYRVLGW